jgi:hypothetical protein
VCGGKAALQAALLAAKYCNNEGAAGGLAWLFAKGYARNSESAVINRSDYYYSTTLLVLVLVLVQVLVLVVTSESVKLCKKSLRG